MKPVFLTAALLLTTAPALQNLPSTAPGAREPIDVPPCHPAAESVRHLYALGILQGFPSTPVELAQNAVRQVFEGLRCGDVAWTTRFLSGVPQGYATGIPTLGAALKPGFDFAPGATTIAGDTATVAFRLRFRDGNAAVERAGTARLTRTDATGTGWQVDFASLAGAGLPFFPAN